SSAPLYSLGDGTQLANVLLNMGINSRDAMAEMRNGVLSFTTASASLEKSGVLCQSFNIDPGDYAVISVSDTGTGISKATLEHLFEPFFTTKPKGKGTGLGLANVWGYVENYKGAVEIKSELGAGSTFTLYFPLTKKKDPAEAEMRAGVPGAPVSSILVIDDDPTIRHIALEILTNKGYTVFSAEDGKKAVAFFSDSVNRVDVALLDMIMPELNGRDTFYQLRKIDPNLRVIMVSGTITPHDMKPMLDEPGTAFLSKPFSKEQLLSAVRAMAGARPSDTA
ncbi:MAG TPA: response regulator, partial [Chitinivibrionales bacterium]